MSDLHELEQAERVSLDVKYDEALDKIAELEAALDANRRAAADAFSQVAELESQVKRLRELLNVAVCPHCTAEGAFAAYNGEPSQCQFCAERDAVLREVE